MLLVEAESTLAQVHGFLLIPQLPQTEDYFRESAPCLYPECDVGQGWDLLSCRQAHRPAGVMRLLEVMIDEEALKVRGQPEVMAGQVRHLLELADSPHATVRVIPKGTPIWEKRCCNFDILSFAGTTDRIGVCYYPVLGAEIVHVDVYDVWAGIEGNAAAGLTESRAILEQPWPPSAEPRRTGRGASRHIHVGRPQCSLMTPKLHGVARRLVAGGPPHMPAIRG